MPAAAIGGLGLIGSIGSSLIGANGASKAADAQAAAAQQASQLQGQAGQQALGIQQSAGAAGQKELAPYTAAGGAGLNALEYGLGIGGTANGSGVGSGSLLQPYGQSFTAPTGITAQNDPGYQARLQLGQDAIQRSAAAKGGVVTGGTAQALNNEAQDYASNEYGNVYNRALNTFDTNFNAYNTGQTNQFNRLAGIASSGQAAAGTAAQLGVNSANSQANTITGTASQQGQDLTNAGNATASGYVGQANAYSGGINNATNGLTNLYLLNSLRSGSGYGNYNPNQTNSPDMG